VANTARIGIASRALNNFAAAAPLPISVREAALEQVDQDLGKEGLLDKVGGDVSPAAQERLGWTRTMTMPTPGVLVKGKRPAAPPSINA